MNTFEGHNGFVLSVCFSFDGKFIVSGSEDRSIIIWDVKTGKNIKTLKGHRDFVTSVCYNIDGKYIASGSDDKTIKIWDAITG